MTQVRAMLVGLFLPLLPASPLQADAVSTALLVEATQLWDRAQALEGTAPEDLAERLALLQAADRNLDRIVQVNPAHAIAERLLAGGGVRDLSMAAVQDALDATREAVAESGFEASCQAAPTADCLLLLVQGDAGFDLAGELAVALARLGASDEAVALIRSVNGQQELADFARAMREDGRLDTDLVRRLVQAVPQNVDAKPAPASLAVLAAEAARAGLDVEALAVAENALVALDEAGPIVIPWMQASGYLAVAEAQGLAGDLAAARASLGRAQEIIASIESEEGEWLASQTALAQITAGLPEEGLAALTALDPERNDFEAWTLAGQRLAERGYVEQALAVVEQPGSIGLGGAVAQFLDAGRLAEAEAVLDRMSEGRDREIARSLVAAAHARAGDLGPAEAMLPEVAFVPAAVNLLVGIAQGRADAGQTGEARRAAMAALQVAEMIEPVDFGLFFRAEELVKVAPALARSGDAAGARMVLEAGLEHYNGQKDLSVIRREVARELARAGLGREAVALVLELPEGPERLGGLLDVAVALEAP